MEKMQILNSNNIESQEFVEWTANVLLDEPAMVYTGEPEVKPVSDAMNTIEKSSQLNSQVNNWSSIHANSTMGLSIPSRTNRVKMRARVEPEETDNLLEPENKSSDSNFED